ncbi:MAG: metal-sulfur cluster assembly factor, partial [Candidatus Binatia bacterium]
MEEEVSESQPTETSPAASGEGIKEKIIGVLRTIYDPEIPVDIYELGLVYDVDVNASGVAEVKMTLT